MIFVDPESNIEEKSRMKHMSKKLNYLKSKNRLSFYFIEKKIKKVSSGITSQIKAINSQMNRINQ